MERVLVERRSGRKGENAGFSGRLAVDPCRHQRDGLLIDRGGVPLLNDGKVRLALLIARTRTPAFGGKVICRRRQGIRLLAKVYPPVAIAIDAIGQSIAQKKLRVAPFAVLGPDGLARD